MDKIQRILMDSNVKSWSNGKIQPWCWSGGSENTRIWTETHFVVPPLCKHYDKVGYWNSSALRPCGPMFACSNIWSIIGTMTLWILTFKVRSWRWIWKTYISSWGFIGREFLSTSKVLAVAVTPWVSKIMWTPIACLRVKKMDHVSLLCILLNSRYRCW